MSKNTSRNKNPISPKVNFLRFVPMLVCVCVCVCSKLHASVPFLFKCTCLVTM